MRLLSACRRMTVDRPPVWFMRQCGPVLSEYRSVRKSLTYRQIIDDPELASRLAVLPVEQFDVDAALVLTDLRLPLVSLGLLPELADEVVAPPAGWPPQRALRLRPPRAEDFGVLPETVARTARSVAGRADVLGVVAAPFSLAVAALDPAAPAQPANTLGLIYSESRAWPELAAVLTDVARVAADLQVSAGASVLHVFDSWAGALTEADYRRWVLPWSRQVFEAIAALGVPAIHFVIRAGHLIEAMCEAGGEVIGVGPRVDLAAAWARAGVDRGLQGNLDPTVLLGPLDRGLAAAGAMLALCGKRPGYVFGLGHGLLPSTRGDVLRTLVRYVHAFDD